MLWRSPWKRWMNSGERAVRRRWLRPAGVLACAGLLFVSARAAERTAPAPRAAQAAVWDTLSVLEAATRWRNADSVVTAYVAEPPDIFR